MRRWAIAVSLMAATASAERLRGPDGKVRDVPAASVPAALESGYMLIPKVQMRATDGTIVPLDEDLVAGAERAGWWKMTAAEIDAEARSAARARADAIAEEQRESMWRRQEREEKAKALEPIPSRSVITEPWFRVLVGIAVAIGLLLTPWRSRSRHRDDQWRRKIAPRD